MLTMLALTALFAQEPQVLENGLRLRLVDVAPARGGCVVLGLGVGSDQDPAGKTGLAEAVGEWLRLTQEGRPAGDRWQVSVHAGVTVVSLVLEHADEATLEVVLARCASVLDGSLPLTDDLAARAAAAAALRADDATEVFPGPQLMSLARRRLLAGTPGGRQSEGIPSEMASIGRACLEAWSRAHLGPGNARLVVLAPLSVATQLARVRAALGGIRHDVTPPASAVHDALGPPAAELTSDRVAGPYVGLALRAPAAAADDYAAFVVGRELLSSHVWALLRDARGGEAQARASPFVYRFDTGEQVVLMVRRGRDDDAPVTVRRELEVCVEDFLRRTLQDAGAIEAAAARAARMLRDPAGEARSHQGALFAWARRLLFADVLGWPPDFADRLERVPAARVQEVMAAALQQENRCWLAVVPKGS